MPPSSSEGRNRWRKWKRGKPISRKSKINEPMNDEALEENCDEDDPDLDPHNHTETDDDYHHQSADRIAHVSRAKERETLVDGGVKICEFPVAVKRVVSRPHSSVFGIVELERSAQNGESRGQGHSGVVVLENISHGQLQVLSAVPRDSVALLGGSEEETASRSGGASYVIRPPPIIAGSGVTKRFGSAGRVHVVPLHADWFSSNSAHRLERQVVPHFFSGKSADHTPEKYIECRNLIVAKYMENPEKHLSVADCLDIVAGIESDDLTRIMRFLDHWGIINYCATPLKSELQTDSTYLCQDSNGELCVPSAALKSIDSLIQFDKPKCRLKATDVYPELGGHHEEECRLKETDIYPELGGHHEEDSDFDGTIRGQLSEHQCNHCSRRTPVVYYQSQKEDVMEQNDSSMASNSSFEDSDLKKGSGDIGWETGILEDPTKPNNVKCTLCGKVTTAGINRHKIHIAGIKGKGVRPCPKANNEQKIKCLEAIEANKSKRIEKVVNEAKLRDDVVMSFSTREEEDDEISIIEGGSRKRPIRVGPMDNFSRPIKVDGVSASKIMKQQNINDAIAKKMTLQVHQYLARWVYEVGIPFNSIDNDSFKCFVEALGQYGPGYTPPSQYQLREPLLKGEVERTKETLKKQEEEWKSNGCSIMTDAWSDRKRRSIMNLCVNCKLGTTFLSSKETNDNAHTAQYIFDYVNECIKEVGEENVVQIVTDNASNNMAAANLLKLHRPTIFWTSCATHTLNLMLEGISKLPSFKGVIKKAKSFTIFIYAHHKTLALMRKFTKREIVRPGVTRFASSFLTLQSLLDKKQELRNMMTSNEWDNTKWSKSKKGKEAFDVVVPNHFWNLIELCLRVFTPLVKVLRLVDGEEKPSMGFVYGELQRAKDDIKKTLKKESDYMPILNIIDAKSKDRLDSPLHTTAYFLNAFYYFKNPSIKDDELITNNVITCVEKFFLDVQMQHHVINVELQKYTQKEGAFGKTLAISGCENNTSSYNPVSWWDFYGNQTPNLKFMAKRILGLTTSSSGCERNWSVFESVHTKKRNRLDATRMNNLVYVQFNARLMNKKKRRKDKLETLLASDASNAQSWIVEGCDDDNDDDVDEVVEMENEVLQPTRILEMMKMK